MVFESGIAEVPRTEEAVEHISPLPKTELELAHLRLGLAATSIELGFSLGLDLEQATELGRKLYNRAKDTFNELEILRDSLASIVTVIGHEPLVDEAEEAPLGQLVNLDDYRAVQNTSPMPGELRRKRLQIIEERRLSFIEEYDLPEDATWTQILAKDMELRRQRYALDAGLEETSSWQAILDERRAASLQLIEEDQQVVYQGTDISDHA